jgi:Flp pilus assembly pilin Flp
MKPLKAIRSDRKGQTSVEYLVLLAIAIVIAVVAVGVLSGFIKIGTATTYKKKGLVYWKSADIGIMDWEVYQTSTSQNSTLVLQNNKEYQIRVDWVSTDGGTTTNDITQTLLPGDTYSWTGTTPFNCSAGGSYSYEVTFQYDNLEHSVLNKQFTGVEKMAGSCSN